MPNELNTASLAKFSNINFLFKTLCVLMVKKKDVLKLKRGLLPYKISFL